MISSNDQEVGKLLKSLIDITRKLFKFSFGGKSSQILTGTTPWTGNAFAITFITENTPQAFTMDNASGTFAPGITYPAGLTLYGNITSYTPEAGETVILYTL